MTEKDSQFAAQEENPTFVMANKVEAHRGFEKDVITKLKGPIRMHAEFLRRLRDHSDADKIVIHRADGATIVDLNRPLYRFN